MLGRIYGHSCADASSFQRHLPHPMTLARRKEKDACKRTCVLRCRAQARACTGGRAPGASVQTHAHGQARATMQALTPSLAMKHEPVRTHTSRCICKREHCDNSRKHTCIEMCMQYHANALDMFTCTGRVCGLPRAGVCASSRGHATSHVKICGRTWASIYEHHLTYPRPQTVPCEAAAATCIDPASKSLVSSIMMYLTLVIPKLSPSSSCCMRPNSVATAMMPKRQLPPLSFIAA